MYSKPEPAGSVAAARRRHRLAALLIAAAPAATAFALTAAPLTAAIGPAAKPHSGSTPIALECAVSVHPGGLNTMKYPACAGD